MKQLKFLSGSMMPSFIALVTALTLAGCASTGSQSSDGGGASGPSGANKFKATDGRNIEVGKPSQADGGTRYDNPHMEKGKCWVASGFNFNGYDTIYIAPTTCTAKFNEKNAEEVKVNALAPWRTPDASSSDASDTPFHSTFGTRQPVTHWKSLTMRMLGMAASWA